MSPSEPRSPLRAKPGSLLGGKADAPFSTTKSSRLVRETGKDVAGKKLRKVENLSAWRERWERVAQFEQGLKRPMTMQQKVARYLEMRETFASRLKETASSYREERKAYLADLQERLRKQAEFHHGRTSPDTETSSD